MRHSLSFGLYSGLVASGLLVVAGTACRKAATSPKSDSATDSSTSTSTDTASATPGVTKATGDTLAVSGVLALTGTGLQLADEKPRKVLYFSLVGGSVNDAPVVVDVDAKGKFALKISKVNAKIAAAKAALKQSPIDRAALKVAFPEYTKDIDAGTEDNLKSGLGELVTSIDAQGGPQYVLVSYVPGDDSAVEAASFRFVGLPTTGKNVMVFPGDALKGDLSLGKISGTDEDSTAELKADSSVFDFSSNQIAQLASMGQTLKAVRNYWMNKSADGSRVNFDSQPFFAWKAKVSGLSESAYTAADAQIYSGYGMYIKANNLTDATFDELCPAGGTSSNPATPIKSLTLAPPAKVYRTQTDSKGTVTKMDTPFSAATPMDNSSVTRNSQNGQSVCNGMSGFYLRDDSKYGAGQMMINWGTGGSLDGPVPKGLWDLKLDGKMKARFDMSAAFPVDQDGNSKVPIPVVKITKSGDNLTKMTFQFAVYRPEKKAYEVMDDLTLFTKMASNITANVSVGNGSGMDEKRGTVGSKDDNGVTVKLDGNTLTAVPGAASQLPISGEWGKKGTIVSLGVSYKIGSSSYNFSWYGN